LFLDALANPLNFRERRMQNTTNIQETNGRSVTVALPKRFSPRFIGKLIKMQADYPRHSPIWCLLVDAVAWMRERTRHF